MVDPLVVGVDGTTEGGAALDAAVRLARQTGAPLFVVCVEHVPTLAAVGATAGAEGAIAEALEQLDARARAQAEDRLRGSGIDWCFEVAGGDPATELIRTARAHHAAAIVVAGRTHGLVGGLLSASVAQKLVRHSPVSVIVVRSPEAGGHPAEVTDIALPVHARSTDSTTACAAVAFG